MRPVNWLWGALCLLPFAAQANYEDEYCREFTKDIRISGKSEQAYGIACRRADGTWQIVDEEEFEASDRREPERVIVRTERVYLPSFGFFVNLGRPRHYHTRHHHYRDYGYRWRGKNWLNAKRHYQKKRWRKRGGNSYSHLSVKSDRRGRR